MQAICKGVTMKRCIGFILWIFITTVSSEEVEIDKGGRNGTEVVENIPYNHKPNNHMYAAATTSPPKVTNPFIWQRHVTGNVRVKSPEYGNRYPPVIGVTDKTLQYLENKRKNYKRLNERKNENNSQRNKDSTNGNFKTSVQLKSLESLNKKTENDEKEAGDCFSRRQRLAVENTNSEKINTGSGIRIIFGTPKLVIRRPLYLRLDPFKDTIHSNIRDEIDNFSPYHHRKTKREVQYTEENNKKTNEGNNNTSIETVKEGGIKYFTDLAKEESLQPQDKPIAFISSREISDFKDLRNHRYNGTVGYVRKISNFSQEQNKPLRIEHVEGSPGHFYATTVHTSFRVIDDLKDKHYLTNNVGTVRAPPIGFLIFGHNNEKEVKTGNGRLSSTIVNNFQKAPSPPPPWIPMIIPQSPSQPLKEMSRNKEMDAEEKEMIEWLKSLPIPGELPGNGNEFRSGSRNVGFNYFMRPYPLTCRHHNFQRGLSSNVFNRRVPYLNWPLFPWVPLY